MHSRRGNEKRDSIRQMIESAIAIGKTGEVIQEEREALLDKPIEFIGFSKKEKEKLENEKGITAIRDLYRVTTDDIKEISWMLYEKISIALRECGLQDGNEVQKEENVFENSLFKDRNAEIEWIRNQFVLLRNYKKNLPNAEAKDVLEYTKQIQKILEQLPTLEKRLSELGKDPQEYLKLIGE